MKRRITWKQLVLASIMIAVLCSVSTAAGDKSQKPGNRTSLKNFRFARSSSGGNEKLDLQRYHRLWLPKQTSAKPAPNPTGNRNETSNATAAGEFKIDDRDVSNTGKFGKYIALGRAMYIKPRFGAASGKGTRNFALEVGFRYLF